MPQQTLTNKETGERFLFAHATRRISKDTAYGMLQQHGKPSQVNQLPDGTAIVRQSQPNPQAVQAVQQRYQQAHEQLVQQLRGAFQEGRPILQALDAVLTAVRRLGDADRGSREQHQALTDVLHAMNTSLERMLGVGTDGVPVGLPEAQIVYALARDPQFVRSAAARLEVNPQQPNIEAQVAACWRRVATLNDINRALQQATGQPTDIGRQAVQLWARGLMPLLQLEAQVEFMPEVLPLLQQPLRMVMQTGMVRAAQMSYQTPDQIRMGGQEVPGRALPPPINRAALASVR